MKQEFGSGIKKEEYLSRVKARWNKMQIVIDISKDIYDFLQKHDTGTRVDRAIANGIPLPKGHGRLTDLDELINFTYNTYGINSGKCMTKDNEDIIDYIYNKAKTIIEADTETLETDAFTRAACSRHKYREDEENEVEVCSSNFIQLKQDVLNNKQLWRKLREIEDEDSD